MGIDFQAAEEEEEVDAIPEGPATVRRTTTKGGASRNRSSPIKIPATNVGRVRAVGFRSWDENGGAEAGDEEEGMVPPHVIVERRLNGRKTAFSVCTGNGWTLKGRDLRRVRNLVLTRTGFLEGRLVF